MILRYFQFFLLSHYKNLQYENLFEFFLKEFMEMWHISLGSIIFVDYDGCQNYIGSLHFRNMGYFQFFLFLQHRNFRYEDLYKFLMEFSDHIHVEFTEIIKFIIA